VDNEEFEEGLRCVGAPVFDHSGEVTAAVSVAGPAFRLGGGNLPRISRTVISIARQLSKVLGYRQQ
jgi:DNA-binding IclR family transcriptional regulator